MFMVYTIHQIVKLGIVDPIAFNNFAPGWLYIMYVYIYIYTYNYIRTVDGCLHQLKTIGSYKPPYTMGL